MPEKLSHDITKDPRVPAAIDLIGRTGALEFKIQFCDEEKPVAWIASAKWKHGWDMAAGLDPAVAIFRLLDQVIDGGTCTHCQRPTGFEESMDPMPLSDIVCWYQWDPSTKTFARGCGGDEVR